MNVTTEQTFKGGDLLWPINHLYSAGAQDGPQEMEIFFKQQPSMLPGSAEPGCCLLSIHFL